MKRPGLRGAAGKAVLLRLTTEEHATLTASAKRSGLGMGPWLRMLGLAAAEGRGYERITMPAPSPRRAAKAPKEKP